jgi:hypothetical protein
VEGELSPALLVVSVKDPDEAALGSILQAHGTFVGEYDVESGDARLQMRDERAHRFSGSVHEVIHRAARDRDTESAETFLDAVDRNGVGALLDDGRGGRGEPAPILWTIVATQIAVSLTLRPISFVQIRSAFGSRASSEDVRSCRIPR